VPALNKLYQQYASQVAFLVVYITEAHPSDVWQMESNIKDKVVFASPRNEDERAFVCRLMCAQAWDPDSRSSG
jgi:hypothetical protein